MLRCVIAVCRHGDRTPKQKLKIAIQIPEILEFISKYGDDIHKEVVLKATHQLEELLVVTRSVLSRMINEKKNDDKTLATIKALQQMKQVLESGSGIKGFNRKVQLKPLKFDTPISSPHIVHNTEVFVYFYICNSYQMFIEILLQ